MSDRIIVTFDKSQEDIPVLMSFRENSFMYFSNSPAITVINTITSDEAIEIWNRLTKAGGDNEGEWRDIDEGLLDLSSHDAKVRADTIDNFVKEICKMIVQSESNGNYRFYAVDIKQAIADLAEQLKAGDIE